MPCDKLTNGITYRLIKLPDLSIACIMTETQDKFEGYCMFKIGERREETHFPTAFFKQRDE
jgi:hypothetical protein